MYPSIYSYEYYLNSAKNKLNENDYTPVIEPALKCLSYIQLENEPNCSAFTKFYKLKKYCYNHAFDGDFWKSVSSVSLGNMIIIDPSGEKEMIGAANVANDLIKHYQKLVQKQYQ